MWTVVDAILHINHNDPRGRVLKIKNKLTSIFRKNMLSIVGRFSDNNFEETDLDSKIKMKSQL